MCGFYLGIKWLKVGQKFRNEIKIFISQGEEEEERGKKEIEKKKDRYF